MLDIKTLLPELKKLVTSLAEDLLVRSTENTEVDAGLREAYAQIEKGGRTADPFEVWREDYLDQVAVAWVLSCVFVRFMEDNHLIDECWLAGEGERRKLAEDTHELYFREHPHQTDREYFEYVFHEVGKIPACRDLFAEGKTPLWALGPNGDAAMKLLAFWRDPVPESGRLKRSFEVEDSDTRFLGDLYQDLSERARKKYALLQTPIFVEEFILDRTLGPALDEFGLDEVRMIDPTCGSGHFLLGGFARLFDLWIKREDNEVVAAQKALDGVWGVDINPFAVAIARFRLMVAALRACGITRLKSAPAWNIHLATGDSLLFGSRWDRDGNKKSEQQFLGTDEVSWAPEIYTCEDKEAVSEVLGQQYHAVVGNPPYITVKDKALNQAYRDRYSTCHRQYSLGVPFTERFFDLCWGSPASECGYVGMITANSFMKREFGKKLIEYFLPSVELTHVVDTSGAFIPGHGTPTVIIFGRNRSPQVDTVRAVLGIKDEPSAPIDGALGLVWQSIAQNIDCANAEGDFTSSADVPRSVFSAHPWSTGGGGAGELKEKIESDCDAKLGALIVDIGRSTHTGEDNVFYLELSACRTTHLRQFAVPLVEGEGVRDYCIRYSLLSLFPYDQVTGETVEISDKSWESHFWRYRTTLRNRRDFGKRIEERGLRWIDHSMFFPARFRTSLSIAFPFLATHNHFALDRGGKVFDRPAPVIKLADDATEADHWRLLGLLNSSIACFWLKQVMAAKGGGGIGRGIQDESWETRYDISNTQLRTFPVANSSPDTLAEQLDAAAGEYSRILPDAIVQQDVPSVDRWRELQSEALAIRRRMIALQEELDWECYRHYGLLSEDLCYSLEDLPEIACGQRAFEFVMARQVVKGQLNTSWFERNDAEQTVEIPSHWPESYRKLVTRRIEFIETHKDIGLVERPEYKRRWNSDKWLVLKQHSLRDWLLDSLERDVFSPAQQEPRLRSIAEVAYQVSGDRKFLRVAEIFRGRPDFDVASLIAELIEPESVPFLSVVRYKAAGLRKREVWENTWELQRKEDAGEDVGEIKVPPKYTSADFQSSDCWRLRGKLDVPKERWISYPHCETESDPSLVVGWAGWNHLQQATALVAYYDARKREGWDAKRLTPLLAGLDQLLPWIQQWHPEIDPDFGETAGQSFQMMLEADAHELGLTLEEIRAWEPPAKKKRSSGKRRSSRRSSSEAETEA